MRSPVARPEAWMAVAGAVLLLAGCATSSPAPVEDRPGTADAAIPEASGPVAPSADGDGAADVQVQALPESPPARPRPLASAAPDSGGGDAVTRETTPNPAVVALVNRANRESAAGRHDTAAASLERAIKIQPDNAWLWHRLASARFAQGRAGEAASLAARSTALASGDPALQARNWRLIARVHRQRGEDVAAREAERRAQELDAPPS